ncbi:hypothetical protein T439DRAFT_325564, partial [Meredithblackwellia eburnea MCA 4105]
MEKLSERVSGYVTLPYTPIASTSFRENNDGQFAVVTRSEINILTPVLGYQADRTGRIPISKRASSKGKERAWTDMPFFRTSFAIEKKGILMWSEWSNDTRALAPAAPTTSEPFWRDVSWSPSGVGSLGGCMLAALTTNHEVMVYEPLKNAYKGEWVEFADVTAALVRVILPCEGQSGTDPNETPEPTPIFDLFQCQATSLTWTPPVHSEASDYSLLVVGHRSGHISIWRRWGSKMEVLHRFQMAEGIGWIVKIECSAWTIFPAPGRKMAMATLAVADSQGRLWSLELTQDVTSHRSSKTPDLDCTHVVAAPPTPCFEDNADGKAVSEMMWILHKEEDERQLVYTKLGTVGVVKFGRSKRKPSATLYDVVEEEEIDLEVEEDVEVWEGQTPFAACCGLVHHVASNTLIVALQSATFFTLTHSPLSLLPPEDHGDIPLLPSSGVLSRSVRSVFTSAKDPTPTIRQGERLSSFKALSGSDSRDLRGLDLVWCSEWDDPNRLAYTPNSLTRTNLVMAKIFAQDHVVALDLLKEIFAASYNSHTHHPLRTLRSFLHFASDHIKSDEFLAELVSILPSLGVGNEPMAVDSTSDVAVVLEQFQRAFFGEEYLEGLRLRENVARFLCRQSQLPVAHKFPIAVVQTTLGRQAALEVTFRIGVILSSVQQQLLPNEAASLGRHLLASAALKRELEYSLDVVPDPDDLNLVFGSQDTCPACGKAVSFANVRRAECEGGHQWDRCSITLSVISTTRIRTCVSCERKALFTTDGRVPKPGEDQQGGT